VPIDRVVLIVDDTTDVPFLRQVIEQAWASMAPSSPNLEGQNGELMVCRLAAAHDSVGLRTLLASLAKASSTRREEVTVTALASQSVA
jgi:hypothetical protein